MSFYTIQNCSCFVQIIILSLQYIWKYFLVVLNNNNEVLSKGNIFCACAKETITNKIGVYVFFLLWHLSPMLWYKLPWKLMKQKNFLCFIIKKEFLHDAFFHIKFIIRNCCCVSYLSSVIERKIYTENFLQISSLWRWEADVMFLIKWSRRGKKSELQIVYFTV